MERTGIGTFLIGLGMGAAVATLFAPSSGSKARAQISKAAADGADYCADHFKDARDALLGVVERNKDRIARQKEGVTEAIKRGSEAYRRKVS
jgi:gas vesicle protein